MKLDALAFETHFVDHILPVWCALPPETRGTFYSPLPVRPGVPGMVRGNVPPAKTPTLVASSGDLARSRRAGRPTALMEHGAGQSYHGDKERRATQSASYAGGNGRDAQLFLFPGPDPAKREREKRPDARIEVVGCPKLDTLPRKSLDRTKPVICVSFHWDGRVCPETRTAAPYFQIQVRQLAKRFKVIGHGHPRILKTTLARWYAAKGIEVVQTFDEVCARADVYVIDNSSTLFEFASTGRPVVVMNPQMYRRHVHHGLRFWEAATVGVQVSDKEDLEAAVTEALRDTPAQQAAREAALDLVYGYRSGAAARAGAVLVDWVS